MGGSLCFLPNDLLRASVGLVGVIFALWVVWWCSTLTWRFSFGVVCGGLGWSELSCVSEVSLGFVVSFDGVGDFVAIFDSLGFGMCGLATYG